MNDRLQANESPRITLLQVIDGYAFSQLVHVAAELNIADLLKDGPKHYEELAKASGVDPDALYRCLRALSSAGVFTQLEGRCFALNTLSELLRRDIPGSLNAWARYSGKMPYPTWGDLLLSVRTGQNAFEQLHGMSPWEYRNQHPSYRQIFDEAMSGIVFDTASAVVDACNFSKFHRIVDVGGGQGVLLATILKENQSARGVLFDQEQVVQGGQEVLEAAQVLDRCEIIGGSFFDTVPSGGDAYILSHVIHDWDDAKSLQILGNCRRAMKENQPLFIIDRVVESDNPTMHDTFMDLNMMIMLGGCERTKEEFETLLSTTGFEVTDMIPTQSPNHIVKAKAV